MSKYKLNPQSMLEVETWVIILVLSILVAVIIAGIIIIFVYYQKMIQLYRLQQNFINGFTHELKTPIASLQLFLETFSKHELPREDMLKYIDFMMKDTKRLSDNVGRILQLGKLEDKNFKADFHFQDMIKLVEDFLHHTPHLFEEGEITFKSDTKCAKINIDTALFEMLLMNLITNGFRYNKSEIKKISIHFVYGLKNCELKVIDNGIGIEQKELKNIFRKFYQIGKTTKGSGLGLYIAQSICRLHKFELSAESLGNHSGSVFKVVIPTKLLWIEK